MSFLKWIVRLPRKVRDFWALFKLSFLYDLLAHQKRWVRALFVVATLHTIVLFSVAATIVDLIDNAIVDPVKPLSEPVSSLVVLALVGAVTGFGQRQLTSRIGYHVEYEARLRLYDALHSSRSHQLDGLATGQMMTRAITDLNSVQQVVTLVPTMVIGVVGLLAVALYVLIVNPVMAVLAMATLPINIAILRRIWMRLRILSWRRLDSRAETTTAIDDNVRGIRVLKAFGREAHAEDRVRDSAAYAYGTGMDRVRLLAKIDLLLKPVPVVIDAVLMVLAVRFIMSGALTIGQFAIVLALTRLLTIVAQATDEIAGGWTDADAGSGRVQEMLVPSALAPADEPGMSAPTPSNGLEVNGASLQVDGRPQVTDLDLAVRGGQLALIRDASPTARQAIVGLLLGQVAPTDGEALLDRVPLTGIAASTRREMVRHLGEEPFLFGRSVRENLDLPAASGQPTVSDVELWAALDAACAREIVEGLPGGLDAVVGDRGLTLSGGERQRIAIARSLVRPPRLLVIEDGLSAVNPAVELEILRRVRSHARDTAVVMIARRPTAAAVADVVVDPVAGPDTSSPVPSAVVFSRSQPLDPRVALGVVTEPDPTDAPTVDPTPTGDLEERPSIRSVLAPYAGPVAIIAAALVAFTAAALVPAALIRTVIDAAERGDTGTADRVALGLFVLAAVTGVTGYTLKLYYGKVDEGILFLLRRRVFARLVRLGVHFYDRELPGAVATRVVRDLDVISAFVDGGVYLMAIGLALGLGTMGMLFLWSPSVAVVVAGFAVFLVIASVIQFRIADRAFTRQRHQYGEVLSRLQEDYAGRDLIATYGAKEPLAAAFQARAFELRRADRWATSVSNGYEVLAQTVGALATAALFNKAGQLALDGELSTGTVIAMQAFLGTALAPVEIFSSVFRLYLAARVSFRKVGDLYDAGTGPLKATDPVHVTELEGACSFDQVDFSYPGTGRQTLHDVSFEVEPRELVAIVGPTGAGKSSIAKLLWRVYDPDAGSVRLDDHAVSRVEAADLRNVLAVVPQEAHVFVGTVATNIGFADPEASRSRIVEAAERIGVHDELAQLPRGFDTVVVEEGRNLTSVQRQCIALARAALVDPDVLVLDEATSSLEPTQEARVIDAVRALDCTTLVIAHRLAVAEQADRVVVVEDGTVVQTGTHLDLVGSDGTYSQLWGVHRPVKPSPNGAAHGRDSARPTALTDS